MKQKATPISLFNVWLLQFAVAVVDMRDEITLDQAIDYYTAVVHSNINRADNIKKNQRE